jgi:hypothetical protein
VRHKIPPTGVHAGDTLTDFVTMFPTPSASSYGTNQGGAAGRVGPVRPSLETMARHDLWPTPMARDWKGRTNDRRNSEGLPDAVWRTPMASNAEHSGRVLVKPGQTLSLDQQVNATEASPGQLNPTWVEWLMGFPLGWTASEPSETPSSPPAPNTSDDS